MKRDIKRIGFSFAKTWVDKFADISRLIGGMISIKVLVQKVIILDILVFALHFGIKRYFLS